MGKSSGAKSGFVRVVNAPQSLLAAPLITLDADPRRWLDHTLIDIPQDRIKEIAVKPAEGPGYTATRASKDQSRLHGGGSAEGPQVEQSRRGRSHRGIAGAASPSMMFSTRRRRAPTGVSHAVFSTFDGLKIDVAGHKEGTKTLVSFTPTSTAKATEAEAKTLAARLAGWEFEIPSYKYDGMFRALEDLLEKPPEPAAKGGKRKSDATTLPPGLKLPPGLVSPGAGK